MRAAVLERFDAPLEIRVVPDPEPGPGEVVVRTRASGICRTDLKIIDGAIPTVIAPRILGHEPAGEVAAVSPDVVGVAEGDRVAVCLDVSCGACAYCRVGELDHCAGLQRLGFERDGALAEYVRVPAANLIPLADSVTFEAAAALPDAVGSTYHAIVTRAAVRPAQTVAVYGLGGLGLVAVQIARLAGADVLAIARTPERRRVAEELGATALDPRDGDLVEQVRALTGDIGVHAFFDLVGTAESVDAAVRSCRKGGRVIVLAYAVPELRAPMMRLVYDEVSIVGSRSSTRADLHEAARLLGEGRIRPVIGCEVGLEEVNDALDRLRAGAVIGRAVIRFPS